MIRMTKLLKYNNSTFGRYIIIKISHSIRKAIDELCQNKDYESAMMHACNAVDGTASKLYPHAGSNSRFTTFIRENYDILGPMILPDIDLTKVRWPIEVNNPKAPGGQPDFADMIYGVHRCCHAHGSELPSGFEIIPLPTKPDVISEIGIRKGAIALSENTIWGLLAIVMFAPVNKDLHDPLLDTYYLTLGGKPYYINDWWGRKNEMPIPPEPRVVLDFSQLK